MTDGDANSHQGSVTLAGAVAIGIGGMVGGGIFATLGIAAQEAGGATPFAFVVGGVVAALTAASYSKLSVLFPSQGGTVTFIERVFGLDVLSGTVNVLLWVGYIATTALYASAFGSYAAALLNGSGGGSDLAVRALTVVGVFVPWVVNLARASLIARTEGVIVAVKMAILLVVIAAGAPSVEPDRLDASTWESPVAVIAAGMLVFVAYEGFELISNTSAEIRSPRRNLPRAFGWSVGIVIVLYVAIAVIVVGSLDPAEIAASSEYALAQAADASLGQAGFTLVGVSAVLATFSAINATLYGAARLSYTLAVDGELPPEFRDRPWNQPVGLHVTAALGLAIAVLLDVSSISSVASAIFLIVFAAVNVAAAMSSPDARMRRILAGVGAVSCAISLMVLLVSAARNDPTALIVLVVMVAAGLGFEARILKPQRSRRRAR